MVIEFKTINLIWDSWIATWNIILCFHWKPSIEKAFVTQNVFQNWLAINVLYVWQLIKRLLWRLCVIQMFNVCTIHKKDSHLVCTMTNVLLFYLGWKCIAICQEYEVVTQHFCAWCLYAVYITKGLVFFLAHCDTSCIDIGVYLTKIPISGGLYIGANNRMGWRREAFWEQCWGFITAR